MNRPGGLHFSVTVLAACLALGAAAAAAVPARPDGVESAQPDGTKFRLRLRGDEFFREPNRLLTLPCRVFSPVGSACGQRQFGLH
jgi:hypothetical protein